MPRRCPARYPHNIAVRYSELVSSGRRMSLNIWNILNFPFSVHFLSDQSRLLVLHADSVRILLSNTTVNRIFKRFKFNINAAWLALLWAAMWAATDYFSLILLKCAGSSLCLLNTQHIIGQWLPGCRAALEMLLFGPYIHCDINILVGLSNCCPPPLRLPGG